MYNYVRYLTTVVQYSAYRISARMHATPYGTEMENGVGVLQYLFDFQQFPQCSVSGFPYVFACLELSLYCGDLVLDAFCCFS